MGKPRLGPGRCLAQLVSGKAGVNCFSRYVNGSSAPLGDRHCVAPASKALPWGVAQKSGWTALSHPHPLLRPPLVTNDSGQSQSREACVAGGWVGEEDQARD